MSRIEEALRRAGAANRESGLESAQELFEAAWSPSADEDPRRDAEPPSAPSHQFPARMASEPPAVLELSTRWRERLASGPAGDPSLVEQFRRLAATLHHAQQANGLRSVMVSSAMPGDGKTLTAINLALVLAESYRYNVLLIDADLRRPSIPTIVELSGGNGLSDALRSQNEQKLALVPLTSRVTLLPAGQPVANSIEALTSPRMRLILSEATARFDWVILDAPPVGPAADARLLTQMVGGTLFVVHAGKTQFSDVQHAIDAIGREQILGVVLNGVEARHESAYYGVESAHPRQ